MLKLQEKINLAYEELPLQDNEEAVIISVVGRLNRNTLKTETCVIVRGNKITATKILRELLKSSKTSGLSSILEMVKDNI